MKDKANSCRATLEMDVGQDLRRDTYYPLDAAPAAAGTVTTTAERRMKK